MRRIKYRGEEYLVATPAGVKLIDEMRLRGIEVECNCKKEPGSNLCATDWVERDMAWQLFPATDLEEKHLGPERLGKGARLACQTVFR